ncbi:hypothetical protein BQ8482_340141 [Mesorhizobium delmotii]|uniref:Uncharacterized protein n=1 Tax=Mesorhizobium delmotii TaxID=1631247 RepID=A0A2P9AQ14_9HYPH|nr:hypothetical protein BQ8482_340141 [Mesorhizobium delmotii]
MDQSSQRLEKTWLTFAQSPLIPSSIAEGNGLFLGTIPMSRCNVELFNLSRYFVA